MRGLSLVAASGGHSSSRCAGLSLSRPLLLGGTGSRHAGSVVVAHGPSRSAACGILPVQGSNPCPLHWQADSQPLRHQGSLGVFFKYRFLGRLSWRSRIWGIYNLQTFPALPAVWPWTSYLTSLCRQSLFQKIWPVIASATIELLWGWVYSTCRKHLAWCLEQNEICMYYHYACRWEYKLMQTLRRTICTIYQDVKYVLLDPATWWLKTLPKIALIHPAMCTSLFFAAYTYSASVYWAPTL